MATRRHRAGAAGVLPVPPPDFRRLRIYAIDPLAVGISANTIEVDVPFEALSPGPVGRWVEVVDYDPACGQYYSPVDLDDPHLLVQDGLSPSEADPRFHQQMAYAVVMSLFHRFEFALGRGIGWRLGGRRLRILPHGTHEANAYFDPRSGSLVFGYFRANRSDVGHNLPGQYVFTCLSHDIVAHEASHALLHGLRDRYSEPSGPDTLAFHEAFADLVAILHHFSLPGVVEDAIQRSGATLDQTAPLFDLGRQFGEAIGRRAALRSAIGSKADPEVLATTFEPHDRGSILVAAVFDAIISIYQGRTRDLLRIASGGTGVLPRGDVAPDLLSRLAIEARKVATHFLNMVIRAIDYCPPVDIEFGEFLRALITADRDLVPTDRWGYRTALIDAFRRRGIYPRNVFSLAEDSLVWARPAGEPDSRNIEFDRIRFDHSPHEAPSRELESMYYKIFTRFVKKPKNQILFGLDPKFKSWVRSVHPLRRVGPDGRIRNEVVVEVLQEGGAVTDLKGAPPYRGGATLILAENGNGVEVRYCIYKRIGDRARAERQGAYLQSLAEAMVSNTYLPVALAPTFAQIHRGLFA